MMQNSPADSAIVNTLISQNYLLVKILFFITVARYFFRIYFYIIFIPSDNCDAAQLEFNSYKMIENKTNQPRSI